MKKLILTLFLFASIVLSSEAFVDTQHMTTDTFFINTGYSKNMRDMLVPMQEDPYYREDDSNPEAFGKKVKRQMRFVYSYLAPCVDTDLYFFEHDISFKKPSWKDL